MPNVTTEDRIANLLDRAQRCFEFTVDAHAAPEVRREHIGWFIHHVTLVVLLEHLRRVAPDTADQLGPWLLDEGGIFSDGYAGELLYVWREQLASGHPMEPIGPPVVASDPNAEPWT